MLARYVRTKLGESFARNTEIPVEVACPHTDRVLN